MELDLQFLQLSQLSHLQKLQHLKYFDLSFDQVLLPAVLSHIACFLERRYIRLHLVLLHLHMRYLLFFACRTFLP